MLLSQPAFIAFLGGSLVAFQLTPVRRRWVTLLGLSIAFYASFMTPALILVLLAESVLAWVVGRAADTTEKDAVRWRWLVIGTGSLLTILALVRAASTPGLLPMWWPPRARLSSAIGVSYYSLQAISYVADVYLGKTRAERSLGRVMTYLALFPKLIQGPIERASDIIPQLEAPRIPGYEGLRSAALLFGWGLFKKVVLGDRLAQVVDPVFSDSAQFGGLTPVLAAYAFAFQLYFDFSGYTDMARGTATVLGIELKENFRAPYFAQSISEFWRRWHITFSRWLLDYVFSPLQAMWRRSPVAGTAGALFVTFSLSGIWHGFTLPFLAWGLLHGSYLAVESTWRKHRRGVRSVRMSLRVWNTAFTFHLVVFAWIFFRAPTLRVAGAIIQSVLEPTRGLDRLVGASGGRLQFCVTIGMCGVYALATAVRRQSTFRTLMGYAPFRWMLYYGLVITIVLFRQGASGFLYSQF